MSPSLQSLRQNTCGSPRTSGVLLSATLFLLAQACGSSDEEPPSKNPEMRDPAGTGGAGGADGTGGGATGEVPACDTCPVLGDSNELGQLLVFHDEFNRTELDRTVWSTELGMIRNSEEQCYLDRPENVHLKDGMLIVRAAPFLEGDPLVVGDPEDPEAPRCEREWVEGEGLVQAGYTSGSVVSKDTKFFTYGRIEARLRVPTETGAWPAFWLRSQEQVYGGWPKSGEIDVMEHVSQEPNTFYGTVHYEFFNHQESSGSHVLPDGAAEDFHEFRIDWSQPVINWYLDGELYHTFDPSKDIQGRRPFDESFYLIFNVAVGGTWPEDPDPSQFPTEMQVDWVRVWQ